MPRGQRKPMHQRAAAQRRISNFNGELENSGRDRKPIHESELTTFQGMEDVKFE